jgi:succinate dehydrogenase / fumarate reductase, cytochrome b subunit
MQPGLTSDDRYFLLRRLHSLTGIIPIGGFLLFHFFENAAARNGAEAFNQTVLKIGEMPYLYLMEISVLAVPLLFHGIFGLLITADSKPNLSNYPYCRNWAYFLQRLSGVLAFAYIFYHIASTRGWALFIKGSAITFADMQAKVAGYGLAIYCIGILAVVYHFSNGLWSFSVTWGLVKSQEAQKQLAILTQILFLVLAVVGLDILSAFVLHQSVLSKVGALIFG